MATTPPANEIASPVPAEVVKTATGTPTASLIRLKPKSDMISRNAEQTAPRTPVIRRIFGSSSST